MLIGICGKAGSGKDTVFERARYVVQQVALPKPERLAFADKLKDSAAALLGISRAEMEDLKRASNVGLAWVREDSDAEYTPEISMRLFLQRYGTESHRDIFGDDFWVKQALPDGFNHEDRVVMLTDCRFDNEAERVRALGGHIVTVLGANDSDEDTHASEQPLNVPIDFTIRNTTFDDNFESLDEQIVEMLTLFDLQDSDEGWEEDDGE